MAESWQARVLEALGDDSSSSDSSSSSDDEIDFAAEGLFEVAVHLRRQGCLGVEGYVEETVPRYSSSEFRMHFRMGRCAFEVRFSVKEIFLDNTLRDERRNYCNLMGKMR